MEEENYLNPLAPSRTNVKSDEVLATVKPFNPPNPKKTSNKCFIYILLLVVLLSVAFLIFGLVVLRINTPSMRVSRIMINSLNHNSSSLNMAMVAEIQLRNTNFGSFTFRTGITTLMYENVVIGGGIFSNGRVGRREGKLMNVMVNVMESNIYELSRVNLMTNFSRDVSLGLLNLRSFAEARGEISVMRIMDRYRTAVMNCNMLLNLTSQVVYDLSCR